MPPIIDDVERTSWCVELSGDRFFSPKTLLDCYEWDIRKIVPLISTLPEQKGNPKQTLPSLQLIE